MRRERGFTLIELLMALVMTTLVAGSLYKLLLSNQRVYRHQTERVELQGNVRSAVAMLPSELLELNAGDTVDSDVITLGDTLISYKAMRSLFFICQPPVSAGATGSVTLWRNPSYGLRGIDESRDSVVIFAEADPSTRTDNFWVHANVSGTVALGTACPMGAPSMTVTLDNVYPVGGLGAVEQGAPVRSFELVQLFTYPDVNGDSWLGARTFSKSGGWGVVQPVLGPVASGGLQFAYFDDTGAATTTPGEVARVGIQVIGRTRDPVHASGMIQYVVDTLTTQAALRNNPR
jgi:prepilin-type N-terminal cleavage/methylation domain-containing protein